MPRGNIFLAYVEATSYRLRPPRLHVYLSLGPGPGFEVPRILFEDPGRAGSEIVDFGARNPPEKVGASPPMFSMSFAVGGAAWAQDR